MDTEESNDKQTAIEPRFFAVGCVFSLFVAILVAWGFFIGELTEDRRSILLLLVPLASAFISGSFVGALTVHTKGFWPGIASSATGGFGVWLIMSLSLETAGPFTVVVSVKENNTTSSSVIVNAQVLLSYGLSTTDQSTNKEGKAYFTDIPESYKSSHVEIIVKKEGFYDAIKEIRLLPGLLEIDLNKSTSTKEPIKDFNTERQNSHTREKVGTLIEPTTPKWRGLVNYEIFIRFDESSQASANDILASLETAGLFVKLNQAHQIPENLAFTIYYPKGSRIDSVNLRDIIGDSRYKLEPRDDTKREMRIVVGS